MEYLLHFRKSAVWNNGLKDVSYSKCLEYARETIKEHPTLKPVDLITNELKLSSNPGGLVLDFFLGSGSTIIGAESTGRRCFGMELSPEYCSVIIDRFQAFSGKTALKK